MRFAEEVLEYIYDRRANQQESLEAIASELNISGALASELYLYIRSLKDGSLQITNPEPVSESELVTLDDLKNGGVDKRFLAFNRPAMTKGYQNQTSEVEGVTSKAVWRRKIRRERKDGYEEEIVRLYTKEAWSVSDIMVKLDLPRGFINEMLIKNNVSFRETKNFVREKDRHIVLEKARSGEEIKDIAIDLGYSFNVVRQFLEKPVRDRQGNSKRVAKVKGVDVSSPTEDKPSDLYNSVAVQPNDEALEVERLRRAILGQKEALFRLVKVQQEILLSLIEVLTGALIDESSKK